MQNETVNTMGGGNDAAMLEAEVRNAVEQGHDVQKIVRLLTLRKISARSLDIESLRQITRAVLNGARAGAQRGCMRSINRTPCAKPPNGMGIQGVGMTSRLISRLASR